ncbi:hypothetical protein HD806DRAFT_46939 [Xylariaceae sp. AK1471]|nr:hypothetical protein HD806DRAFT_46939 [Xylariaceae sp. AK1471]
MSNNPQAPSQDGNKSNGSMVVVSNGCRWEGMTAAPPRAGCVYAGTSPGLSRTLWLIPEAHPSPASVLHKVVLGQIMVDSARGVLSGRNWAKHKAINLWHLGTFARGKSCPPPP